ncbi:hypothetical protein FNH22_13735 [Fulvivirga sp. M361]|uniref:DUF6503 family protein n=1 Tax=Fulvivirga sp. M361 TaxID=2594266 RepID=UPI00117A7655|nr:DUF6503 family protein [Fulvivirga sp. M361]TRX58405.1 hypothetical protein FNH22_13735 [Fulvivirga sp. M361]
MKNRTAIALILLMITACSQPGEKANDVITISNPPEEGFNTESSDKEAILWADAVMQAMGGRKNWDQLHYVSWNFFGARDLVWDKQTGRVRIDFPRDSSIFLVNINTMDGKVWRKGQEITNPDSLKKYVERAKGIWINDAYWLVMPFKLKDSGVTLKYIGESTMINGKAAQVLELTFKGVGNTPQNKYEVFIDPTDSLVKQWAYYKEADQDSASAIWPWDNYKNYNGLLLSADRSDNKGPKNVKVFEELPDKVFEDFQLPVLE